ncbi:MAG: MFS transporter [Candidatus Hydrogenedentota bacterium]
MNPWAGLGVYFKTFWRDHVLFLVMVGGGFFWFLGGLAQSNIAVLGESVLHLKETIISILGLCLAIGIGTGSLAAGYLSRRKIELGLVPLGVVGMTLSGILLSLPLDTVPVIAVLMFAFGFAGGFFLVPLTAMLQHRSPREMKGGMIAAFNIITCLGIVIAGLALPALGPDGLDMGARNIFLVCGGLTLFVGIYLCVSLPTFLLRTALWVLGNTIYRVETRGREHIPENEGALIVANHTSFLDVLILTASIDRPIRFLISQEVCEVTWSRLLAKLMRVIPVSPTAQPKELIRSLHEATDAINKGELVCVFAEGQITPTGKVLPFRKGFERIMKGTDAPIIPAHLDRLWGSAFRYSDGQFSLKLPKRIPYRVVVAYGQQMPPDSTAVVVRERIQRLGTEAYIDRELHEPLLHRAFVRCARWRPLRMAMADQSTDRVPFWKALVGSIALARKFRDLLDEQPMVGVLLPPTVGAALTNAALTLMGKTVVNLNYTASDEALESAARRCNLTHVITAHAFLSKVNCKVPGQPLYLEDIRKTVKGKDQFVSMIMAAVFPLRALERRLGGRRRRSPGDLATVIFSSGSEGEPKGVMLTHFNIMSNIESALQVFPHKRGDGIVGILPFFHSFGYMATLWLPLAQGFRVVFHPNPLEAKVIGQQIYKHKLDFLIAAPTFLQAFVRRCLPEELSCLRYVITGAEKLPTRVREAFEKKFEKTPLEGYGTTECGPAVSFNVIDFRVPGFYQVGTKHGTVGHPIPGVSLKIIDPDTGEELPQGEAGLLHVKGPSIMKSYIGMPEKTAEVLHDGWYNTGDVAFLDEDGFITITDRLARFSKIAGEMVPHTKVEEELHRLLGLSEQSLAVTGVPDSGKGERLVVLHTLSNGDVERLIAKMDQSSLPKLWLPKYNSFYYIPQIPILGTGKMDIKQVKKIAKELDVGG